MSTNFTPPSGTSRDHADRDDGVRLDRDTVVERQKERYGGIKVGSAFFGWLTATGMAVLLTTLLGGAGTAIGVANDQAGQAVSQAANAAQSGGQTAADTAKNIGIVGGIALLVILFLAYLAGGYVAGRMARFNGAKQGLAVWLWAVVIAVVVAIVGAVAGAKYDVLSQLNSFPRIPVNEGALTTGGIIALIAVAIASLLGAVLGGLLGMRYHRKVDDAGLRA